MTQDEARTLLKKLKNENGFTYTELAQRIGISRTHLSSFVDGKRNFKRDKLFAIESKLINQLKKENVNV